MRYQQRLSGPLRDRIGVFSRTESSRSALLTADSGQETTAVVAERVAEARQRGLYRWSMPNAVVEGKVMRRDYPADDNGMLALQELLRAGECTQRGVDRALRVAWSLADLDGSARPGVGHILDAVESFGEGAHV